MAESITIAGEIMAASLAQTIDYFGETFTIANQLAIAYDTATTEATPDAAPMTVKGIVDNKTFPNWGEGSTDVRGTEKAVVIGTKMTNNEPLSFIPGVGDLITANGLNDSIRDVKVMQGAQGVAAFYRLILQGA